MAVSGGVDSMVLLHTLKELAGVRRWKLAVAHFNHRLRGTASDNDEAFVRKTAAAMKLPVFVGAADIQQIAVTEKVSVEMAARRFRHEFLARTARQRGMNAIALAHHSDDQVELFFLRLLRGAGGSGLGGMQWRSPSPSDRGISLVRPLIDVSKAAVEEFAHARGIRYREDATNRSVDFLRNRIRRELLPLLRENYQPGLNRTILRSMEIAGAESNLAGELARGWLGQREYWRAAPGKIYPRPSLTETDFEDLPEAIQRQVLKLQIIELGIAPDFELIESIRQSPPKPVAVGAKISLSRDAAGCVSRCPLPAPAFRDQSQAVKLIEPGQLVFDGLEMKWRFGKSAKYFGHMEKPTAGTELFDADKVGTAIVIRHWRAGDRFQPIGLTAAVKLQDLFTNAKVPRARRHQLIVAEARSGVFWVEGLRISEKFKLTEQTERALTWKWRRL
ncbi:MAG TPA: tRNA lysidine(34) synthetase TilS [Verrucomicrobiae bacterium]